MNNVKKVATEMQGFLQTKWGKLKSALGKHAEIKVSTDTSDPNFNRYKASTINYQNKKISKSILTN